MKLLASVCLLALALVGAVVASSDAQDEALASASFVNLDAKVSRFS